MWSIVLQCNINIQPPCPWACPYAYAGLIKKGKKGYRFLVLKAPQTEGGLVTGSTAGMEIGFFLFLTAGDDHNEPRAAAT